MAATIDASDCAGRLAAGIATAFHGNGMQIRTCTNPDQQKTDTEFSWLREIEPTTETPQQIKRYGQAVDLKLGDDELLLQLVSDCARHMAGGIELTMEKQKKSRAFVALGPVNRVDGTNDVVRTFVTVYVMAPVSA